MATPTSLDLGSHLLGALPTPVIEALEHISDTADRQGNTAYLVGGIPRDLVMGRPLTADLDVVIVGDAVAVARSVAQHYGGVVRVYGTFGTATWNPELGAGASVGPVDGCPAIDLITARSESYAAPATLPIVQPGSLADDLARRDFVANTLALDMSAARFGQLLDSLGALADIESRQLRALHRASFIDDPTRILRAARYAIRLDFVIETDTMRWIEAGVPFLAQVTGKRILNELERLFDEENPIAALALLEDWGALEAIFPALGAQGEIEAQLAALDTPPAEWRLGGWAAAGSERNKRDRMLLWLASQEVAVANSDDFAAEISARLHLAGRDAERLANVLRLAVLPGPLDQRHSSNSVLYRATEKTVPRALIDPGLAYLAWHLTTKASATAIRQENLAHFGRKLAHRRPLVKGDDLIALGLPAGPTYRRVLEVVHDAVLDGAVATREEALALAESLVAQETAIRSDRSDGTLG